MEEKEGLNGSGITVKGDEVPQSYRVEPRVENQESYGGSSAVPVSMMAPVPETAVKKKRGRPRKYAGDGSIVALSPMPISASIPFSGDYSAWNHSAGRPVESSKKKRKLDSKVPGGVMGNSLGGNFTAHVITVNPGEDISMKIITFSQQGSRAICVLAANGSISNVTLRQSDSSGGTLTYEGRFEILSLTGSFMPSDNGLTKSRSGGMSVSLAGPDGRVLGGGLAGMLVAAGPVQVVIGSFIHGHQHSQEHEQHQKPKKPKYEHTISFGPVISADPISEHKYEAVYRGPNPIITTSASFRENNVLFSGDDSREQSHEITY